MSAVAVRGPVTSSSPRTLTGPQGPKVAYVVSRFPRLTETFIVREMAAVRRAGVDVQLYPIHRERTSVVQPEAAALEPFVHHTPLLGVQVIRSQLATLRSRPSAYIGALRSLIGHNWGSRRLLVGALVSFPLAVDLARRFRTEGVEHVHAHFATHPAAVAYVVHHLTGIPFSFTAHGSDLHRDQRMLAEKVRCAEFVVTVSEYNREVIRRTCGDHLAERVIVVRCGVDPAAFPARPPGTRRQDDPLEVCCIGTLHEVKGQTHLVEACHRARARGTDVRVTLIGEGPDRPTLEQQIGALGLQDHVRLTGPLTQPQVLAELRRADVLAAPSVPSADGRREGLPVVILEAMTVGVPVVASRLSGIPEVVSHDVTGLLVDPGDVEGLANALTTLAHAPARADRLAEAARDEVARRFDVSVSARELTARFAGVHR